MGDDDMFFFVNLDFHCHFSGLPAAHAAHELHRQITGNVSGNLLGWVETKTPRPEPGRWTGSHVLTREGAVLHDDHRVELDGILQKGLAGLPVAPLPYSLPVDYDHVGLHWVFPPGRILVLDPD